MAHVSLILVGLMMILPFLYYYHAYPRTTFYQEWWAAILGLSAMPLLLLQRFWQEPEIPRVVLLPAGLMIIVVVQFLLGQVVYYDQALLFALYLLWAALLIMLGRKLREELGLANLATFLAACLLLGAELNAMVGILQHYRWHTFLDSVVIVKTTAAIYGNVAQPNHFANYIAMGLISLGLLRMRWTMRAWLVTLLALPLLFVLVLSGSRSGGVYLIWMVALAGLWCWRDKSTMPQAQPEQAIATGSGSKRRSATKKTDSKAAVKGGSLGAAKVGLKTGFPGNNASASLLLYSALLMLGFVLMHLVVQLPGLAGADGTLTTVQRLFGEGNSGGIRLYLWREGWLIFSQFPLLGAGFGQFAWQHFLLTEQIRDINIAGLYNNAHNLLLQIAAEAGLAGLLVLLGTLAAWLYQALRTGERNIYHWWAYCILAVLGIHGLLEYPLWYAYFLGIAALMLGITDNTVYRLELRRVIRLSIAVTLVLGLMSLSQMWQGYRKMEALLAMRPASEPDNANYNQRMRDGMLEVQDWQMMVSMSELYMTNMIELQDENLADKRALNYRVMRFAPISPVVYREAILLALSGEMVAAERQITRAIWSYPADFEMARQKLAILAVKDPARFEALLKFASEKFEEQQRAVFAK